MADAMRSLLRRYARSRRDARYLVWRGGGHAARVCWREQRGLLARLTREVMRKCKVDKQDAHALIVMATNDEEG